MAILRLLLLVAFLAAGLVVGSLNRQRIVLDFGLAEVVTTTGIAVMVALLAGVLLGGVTMALGMLVHEASVLVVILNAMRLLRPERRRVGVQTVAAPDPVAVA